MRDKTLIDEGFGGIEGDNGLDIGDGGTLIIEIDTGV